MDWLVVLASIAGGLCNYNTKKLSGKKPRGGAGRNGSPPYAHGSAGSGSIGQGGGMGGGGGAAAGATGVVILRMLTSKYSGTTTGSPSVATDGSHTVLTYNSPRTADAWLNANNQTMIYMAFAENPFKNSNAR